MKRSGLLLFFAMLLSACSPAPAPAPTPDLNATVAAISGTMLAGTLTAQPSSTPLPTETPQPTATTAPSDTPTPGSAATPSLSPAQITVLAPTSTAWIGTFSPGNTNDLPTGILQIINNTGQPEIMVTLNGITTSREQPVYYAYTVNTVLNLNVYWASYQYMVQIPGKRIMTGSYTQQSKDKTTMRVDLTKVAIIGP